MEAASYRKKAMKIESHLLGRLAMFGQGKFASFLGMNEAQVSRMKVAHGNQKYSFFGLMGMAMAMLEVEAPDSDIAKTLLRIEQMLSKKKAPTARTDEASQITLNF